MHGQQENRDLTAIYNEGIMTRVGANIAGVRAKAGQAVGNLISGNRDTSAAQAGQNAKVQYAYKAAARNLVNDLQKLGALPKGSVPQSATAQAQSAISNIVGQIQPTTATQQTTSTAAPAATTQSTAAPTAPASTVTAPKTSQPVSSSPTTQPSSTTDGQAASVNMDAASSAAATGSLKDIDRAINLTTKTLSQANSSTDPETKKLRNSIAFQLRALQNQKQTILKQQAATAKAEKAKQEARRKEDIKNKLTQQQPKPNLPEQRVLNGRVFKEYFTP